ncbi:MAG: hypothetical protein J6I69_02450 [Bacilli bacterium]|nr:hypothetical protein [Bacilli bacterium]
MCNNSLIYMITPTTTAVTSGGVLPLSTIARRRGKSISSETDSVLLSAPGYYKINACVTFSAPAPGVVTIRLAKDGVAVPGITGSDTITVATTELRTISISGIVRVSCCGDSSSLSLINSGIAITATNISFDVEYLD